ncbi:ATP-binding protein [Pseudonocardia broussonetiae]|uniref:ATP-binding protein n=1 Tax=Pseudonocardia broussonetiae TaxID=2736640 RepID=A0A6M6JI78_9PSEU|nr:ATP-binding protein [Pseudonocardia broussonetiae]QJY47774.1 ATP-binding protein [Pseudonocardia broussonetiae]
MRITVADRSTDLPQIQVHDVHAGRGRGLQMVDALSTPWGWFRVGGGTAVWATLPVSNSPLLAAGTADRSPAEDQKTTADVDREHQ